MLLSSHLFNILPLSIYKIKLYIFLSYFSKSASLTPKILYLELYCIFKIYIRYKNLSVFIKLTLIKIFIKKDSIKMRTKTGNNSNDNEVLQTINKPNNSIEDDLKWVEENVPATLAETVNIN